MFKAVLLSFVFPKVMTLYAAEVLLLGNIIRRITHSLFSWGERVQLVVFRSQFEKTFASIVVLEFFFKLSLLLLLSMASGELGVEKIAYQIKMLLYFYFFLFLPYNYIGALIKKYIGIIVSLHFTISLVILSYSFSQYSFQTLLVKSNTFGMRFVGFTGSSLGFDGFTLIGSTANSVGILYLLLFIYFQNNKSHYFLKLICILGLFLSFSQTALLGFFGYLIVLFFNNINRINYWVGLFSIIFILSILSDIMGFSVIDRLINNIEVLISSGQLPSTIYDRYLQYSRFFLVIAECQGVLFLGEYYSATSQCPPRYIIESYFLDQLQTFGLVGLTLAFIKFFGFIYILKQRSGQKLNYFYLFWFLSNLFLANTFETDFILLALISIYVYRREGEFNASRRHFS